MEKKRILFQTCLELRNKRKRNLKPKAYSKLKISVFTLCLDILEYILDSNSNEQIVYTNYKKIQL